jgi:orotate phosphoribosyltransferase-like protein
MKSSTAPDTTFLRNGDPMATTTRSTVKRVGFDAVKYAVRPGHFEVVPGFHVSQAILCSLIFKNVAFLADAALDIIQHYGISRTRKIDAIVTVTSCGMTMAIFASNHLVREFGWTDSQLVPVPGDALENEGTWASSLKSGNKCLLLFEHALNGRRVMGRVVTSVRRLGGEILGIGVLCDRRRVKGDVEGVPVYGVIDLSDVGVNADLDEGPCPLCEDGVPLTTGIRVV